MPKQIEKKLVEDYAVERLQELNWQFITPSELVRESTKEPLLIENLKQALFKLNENLDITEEEINEVVINLQLLPTDQEGIKKFLSWLKYGMGIKFEKDGVVKYVQLLDFKDFKKNEFIFSRQVHYKGIEVRIPDIMFYVNGIPLSQIECKNLVSIRTGWEEGYYQIKEYENIIPELYKYVQIGISLAERARYFPIVPWQEEVKTYLWREDGKAEDEAIFETLKPDVFLDILRNFLFIREEKGKVTKVIARYMQYRAVNKIYQRVVDGTNNKEVEKNKGLIWHWQGSGKTLTMIFAAHKLYFEEKLNNPSIFFIIDRRDLEEQLNIELGSLGLNFSFEKIERVKKLKEIIAYDNFRGKRGVFLTLIHKFQPGEKFLPEDLKNGIDVIANRKNIICFLDEVHRSQYGLLAAQMKDVLKSAYFFGFTGTPISEDDRSTYREFGYPVDKEPYLDKYFIDDSIKDGFTVPIAYEPRLEKRVHVEKINLSAFLSNQFKGEDLDEIEKEKIKEVIKQRLNKVNVFLENEQRINIIAVDIAKHFKEHLDGRFKAMVVAGSRKACVLYKKYLDQYLPPEYSEVVMTFNQSDRGILKDFYREWRNRYKETSDDEQVVRKIVDHYKNQENPKILIVMDMLITGFDAPILQTMYLDRFLKKHRLLQAIARVNRPFEDVKGAGLIIDYVGILNEFKTALGEYYKEKIGDLFVDFDTLFKIFKELIDSLKNMFSDIDFEIERENLIAAIDRLRDEENERVFIETYKQIRKIFEVLGSFERKLDYLNEFQWLTAVYEYYLKLKMDEGKKSKIEHYFRETIKTIHKATIIKELECGSRQDIIGLDYLKKIEKAQLKKEEKAINILFSLERLILVHQGHNPVYRSIAETVEELIRKWRRRLIDYEELIDEERKIICHIEKQENTREELKLTPFEFGLSLILKEELEIKDNKTLINLTKRLIDKIKDILMIEEWQENRALRQNVLRKSREYAVDLKRDYGISLKQMDNLHKKIVEILQNYGNAKSISN